MEMGDKIKILRKQNKMTLEQVGTIVGVGKSTVRKWESGEIANMRRDKIASLARALHTTPAYLMGWDDSSLVTANTDVLVEVMSDQNIMSRIEKLMELSDESKSAVYNMIDLLHEKESGL